MDFMGDDLLSRVLANVIAGIVVLTALFLLRIAYRYFLNFLGTGKMVVTEAKYAELHTLVNNRSASGTVNFYFILKEASHVKLVIADKDDNQLKVLVDEDRTTGDYPVSFNTAELPNGIYFYQLHTDLQKISKVFKIENPID